MPGTVRPAVGKKICNKILGKISVKKLVNKCAGVAVLKTVRSSTVSQCNFLLTGVILAYLLVFDTILAALFWMHCNLRRLNLERLKSELQ